VDQAAEGSFLRTLTERPGGNLGGSGLRGETFHIHGGALRCGPRRVAGYQAQPDCKSPQGTDDQAIIVLWLRACLLNTDRLMGCQYPGADKPFFSDDGLYGGS